MTLRQTLFLAALTALYLTFELAFNARLLDVVGGAASVVLRFSSNQAGDWHG